MPCGGTRGRLHKRHVASRVHEGVRALPCRCQHALNVLDDLCHAYIAPHSGDGVEEEGGIRLRCFGQEEEEGLAEGEG